MMLNAETLQRRHLLGTGLGLGALIPATAVLAASENTKEASPQERANIQFVTDFCKAWHSRDVEQLIPFVAEDLEYHVWEGGTVVRGHGQLRAVMGPFMADMREIKWELFRSAAMGEIVLNDRADRFWRRAGSEKPDMHIAAIGVFVVRKGKIKYWADYVTPIKP